MTFFPLRRKGYLDLAYVQSLGLGRCRYLIPCWGCARFVQQVQGQKNHVVVNKKEEKTGALIINDREN